jgi:hypothetical protein
MINVTGNSSGLDEFEEAIETSLFQLVIRNLTNIGELYIARARERGNYTDQTGNLRGAHSYIVYHNGERVAGVIGRPETLEMFEQLRKSEGWQFMVGDGMDYTSYVEGKGYDVCTSAFMTVERAIREKF